MYTGTMDSHPSDGGHQDLIFRKYPVSYEDKFRDTVDISLWDINDDSTDGVRKLTPLVHQPCMFVSNNGNMRIQMKSIRVGAHINQSMTDITSTNLHTDDIVRWLLVYDNKANATHKHNRFVILKDRLYNDNNTTDYHCSEHSHSYLNPATVILYTLILDTISLNAAKWYINNHPVIRFKI